LDLLDIDVELLGVSVDVELVLGLFRLKVVHDGGPLLIEFAEELKFHGHHFLLFGLDLRHPLVVLFDLFHDLALLHFFNLLNSFDIVLFIHLMHKVLGPFLGDRALLLLADSLQLGVRFI